MGFVPNFSNSGHVSSRIGEINSDKKKGEELFSCNICLDLAKEPIVTCCGHLFCWHCIYRWLKRPTSALECPVCKGGVKMSTMTPIYGRGASILRGASARDGPYIPLRPRAHRVESLRESVQRAAGPTETEPSFDRMLTSRGMRRQAIDLMGRDPLNDEVMDYHSTASLGGTSFVRSGPLSTNHVSPLMNSSENIFDAHRDYVSTIDYMGSLSLFPDDR